MSDPLSDRLHDLYNEIAERDRRIEQLESQLAPADSLLRVQDELIEVLHKDIAAKDRRIEHLEATVEAAIARSEKMDTRLSQMLDGT